MPLTPYQTIGPFFAVGLEVPGAENLADDGTAGCGISIEGLVLDGAREPVPDAVIEIWQADASGHYAGAVPGVSSPAPARSGFRGFGRCATNPHGRFGFSTVMPGGVTGARGLQAPHLVVGVLSRGIQTRLLTRMYFEDEPLNDGDEILQMVPPERRATLIARRVAESRYRFTIVLQGEAETVFFDV